MNGFTIRRRTQSIARLARLGPLLGLALAAGCGGGRAGLEGVVVAPTNAKNASLNHAVVYALPGSGIPKPRSSGRGVLEQTARGFEPAVLVVTQNSRVEFRNHDRLFHNAFSAAPVKRFDLGRYGPGETREVVFDRIGVVPVFCELHPKAAAHVVVVPDALYAQPGANGSFALRRLDPGEYTIKVWHPVFGEKSRKVTVPKKGKVELQLAY